MRQDAAILRPSSHFKKLSYDQVCVILELMEEVDLSTDSKDRLNEKEQDAKQALSDIKQAMEDKRAREDAEARERKCTKRVLKNT